MNSASQNHLPCRGLENASEVGVLLLQLNQGYLESSLFTEIELTLKINSFLKLAQINENAKRNSVHISLNFDPSEKHSKEKLIEIAETYMDKFGFGKQPYLVCEHQDAGHPHLHIVTNNIQRDGKRIDLHLLGIRKSEPARKEIEELLGLVKAEGRNKTQTHL